MTIMTIGTAMLIQIRLQEAELWGKNEGVEFVFRLQDKWPNIQPK